MNQTLLIILVVVAVFSLFALRVVWDLFATVTTINLMRDSKGAFSLWRLVIWLGVIGAITVTLVVLQKRQQEQQKKN
jgi:NhaP-type Na+/H+ or K+/H+ antiporter